MKSLILCFCVCLAGAASAKTLFRYNAKSGDVMRYKSVANTELTMSQMGHDMTFNSVNSGTIRAEVENFTTDHFTYLTSFENFTISLNGSNAPMGMGDTTFNVTDVVGKRTRRVSTTLGHELSAVVVDTVHFESPMVKQFAQGSKNMLRPFMELPENPVGPGETWTIAKKDTQPTDGGAIMSDVKMNCTYVRDLDTLGRHCAVVSYKVTIGMEGTMKVQGQFDATITGDGTGKGTGYFDYAAGALVANVSTMELNQQMALTGQMNMVIPQTITTNTQTVLIQ